MGAWRKLQRSGWELWRGEGVVPRWRTTDHGPIGLWKLSDPRLGNVLGGVGLLRLRRELVRGNKARQLQKGGQLRRQGDCRDIQIPRGQRVQVNIRQEIIFGGFRIIVRSLIAEPSGVSWVARGGRTVEDDIPVCTLLASQWCRMADLLVDRQGPPLQEVISN